MAHEEKDPAPPASHAWRLSESALSMRFSAIRRMSELIEKPGIISFAPGQPSSETFPVESFREIVAEVIAREGAAAFQYIQTRGHGGLLAAVREYAREKGIESSPPALRSGTAARGAPFLCASG